MESIFMSFNYVYNSGKRFRGVIAQELLETHPEAVFGDEESGILAVAYDKIDIKMEEVN